VYVSGHILYVSGHRVILLHMMFQRPCALCIAFVSDYVGCPYDDGRSILIWCCIQLWTGTVRCYYYYYYRSIIILHTTNTNN